MTPTFSSSWRRAQIHSTFSAIPLSPALKAGSKRGGTETFVVDNNTTLSDGGGNRCGRGGGDRNGRFSNDRFSNGGGRG